MYSLLVVDDEFFIREGLSKDVDWNRIGVQVVATAQNGQEAILIIDQLHPDIILADINMNTMSGIEMLEKLREANNEAKVIFLSGYDDFQYTQKAIELKAFDYIMKPILVDDLLVVVARATEEIQRDRNLKNRISDMEKDVALGRRLAQEKFLMDAGLFPLTPEWEMQAQGLGIPVKGHCFCVAAMELDEAQSGNPRLSMHLLAAKEIAEEYASQFSFHIVMIHASLLILIMGLPEDAKCAGIVDGMLNSLRTAVRSLMDGTCTIGVSRIADGVHMVAECRAEAARALDYKITVGRDCVIHSTDMPSSEQVRMFYPKAEEKQLLEALGTMDKALIRQAIEHFMDTLARRQDSAVQVRAVLAALISALTRRFLEWDIDIYDSFHEFWKNPYTLMEKYQTIRDIQKWLTELVMHAVTELESVRSDSIRGIISQVQKLIQERYADADLSLPVLAGQVYLSPAYLSKLYKKETGATFVEYLTSIRMQEAKKLLKTTYMKSAEIGTLVGYPNAQYFCFLFKKYFGVSPIDFRDSGR